MDILSSLFCEYYLWNCSSWHERKNTIQKQLLEVFFTVQTFFVSDRGRDCRVQEKWPSSPLWPGRRFSRRKIKGSWWRIMWTWWRYGGYLGILTCQRRDRTQVELWMESYYKHQMHEDTSYTTTLNKEIAIFQMMNAYFGTIFFCGSMYCLFAYSTHQRKKRKIWSPPCWTWTRRKR